LAAIQTAPTAGTITDLAMVLKYNYSSLSNMGQRQELFIPLLLLQILVQEHLYTVDVTVNPNSTIVLSSVSGSDNPTNCVNTVLNISYAIGGGGTNASITAGALPAGVTGSYNVGTRVLQSVEIHL
jgi:hypothetical protein